MARRYHGWTTVLGCSRRARGPTNSSLSHVLPGHRIDHTPEVTRVLGHHRRACEKRLRSEDRIPAEGLSRVGGLPRPLEPGPELGGELHRRSVQRDVRHPLWERIKAREASLGLDPVEFAPELVVRDLGEEDGVPTHPGEHRGARV